jgi:hypothetical protein
MRGYIALGTDQVTKFACFDRGVGGSRRADNLFCNFVWPRERSTAINEAISYEEQARQKFSRVQTNALPQEQGAVSAALRPL